VSFEDLNAPDTSPSYAEQPEPNAGPVGPNNPPWNSWVAIGVWLASVGLIMVIPALFLLPYLASIKPPISDTEQLVEFAKTDPTSLFLQIFGVLPAHLLTILLAWLIVTRVRKYSFTKVLGWESGGVRWWHYIALILGFFAIAALVSSFIPEQDNDLLRILRSSRAAVYVVAFAATFTAPLVEEVIYRGLLYSAFQRAFGVPAAFVLVTILFAIVHVPQYFPSYATILLLTLLSLMLTFIRVWSNNLLPCVIMHTIFNAVQSLGIVIEALTKTPDGVEPTASLLHLFK
jgi:membrane protease YdiL (CAAX protease family)